MPFCKRILKATAQHGIGEAWARHGMYELPSSSTDDLWATCPLSTSSGYHVEFHEDCRQNFKLKCSGLV
jgi:hypothetical protein